MSRHYANAPPYVLVRDTPAASRHRQQVQIRVVQHQVGCAPAVRAALGGPLACPMHPEAWTAVADIPLLYNKAAAVAMDGLKVEHASGCVGARRGDLGVHIDRQVAPRVELNDVANCRSKLHGGSRDPHRAGEADQGNNDGQQGRRQ